MSAYVVFTRTKTIDQKELEKYWTGIQATMKGHPIEVLVAYGKHEVLEGDPIEGIVIAKFPNLKAAKDWYHSEAYQRVAKHRKGVGADSALGSATSGFRPIAVRFRPQLHVAMSATVCCSGPSPTNAALLPAPFSPPASNKIWIATAFRCAIWPDKLRRVQVGLLGDSRHVRIPSLLLFMLLISKNLANPHGAKRGKCNR